MKSEMDRNKLDHNDLFYTSLCYPVAVNTYKAASVGVTEAYDNLDIACRTSLKNNLDYLIVKGAIKEDPAFNEASEEIKEALEQTQKKAVEVACRASVKKTLAYRLLQQATNEKKEHPALYKAAYAAKQYVKTSYNEVVNKTSVANKKIIDYRRVMKRGTNHVDSVYQVERSVVDKKIEVNEANALYQIAINTVAVNDVTPQEVHACDVAKKSVVLAVKSYDEAIEKEIEKFKAHITEEAASVNNLLYKEEAYREANKATTEAIEATDEFKLAITDAITLAGKTHYKEAFEASVETYQTALIDVDEEVDEYRSFHKEQCSAVNNAEISALYLVSMRIAEQVTEVTEEVTEEFKATFEEDDKLYHELSHDSKVEINSLYKEASQEVYEIARKSVIEATNEAIEEFKLFIE